MTAEETIRKCRKALEEHYQSRFKGLVLFGSMARREASPGSDIDLMVLLDPPFDYFFELRLIVDLLYSIQLDCEQLISARPAAVDEYNAGAIQLYRSAKREGALV
jgi:uncharacterized protein